MTKTFKKYITSFFFLVGLYMSSCVENISLDLPSTEDHIVVFGWVTNANESYAIIINETNDFNNIEEYKGVIEAEVYLLETDTFNISKRIDFEELEGNGRYYSNPEEFIGEPGNTYELHILITDSMHIVSSKQVLNSLSNIDSTFINFVLDPDEVDLDPEEDNYYVTGLVNDEVAIENYYRWKIYVNGEIRNEPVELVLFDDKFTDGNLFRFDASNVLFKETDEVYIEHLSLTKSAYQYYSQLKDLTSTNVVGPISKSYVLEGNLTDISEGKIVLGFFGASEVQTVGVQNVE